MSSRNDIRTPEMSETRRHEVEEMDQWELLELIEQIRDIVWLGEDASDVIRSVRDLVGIHEDAEAEDYDGAAFEDEEDTEGDPEELDLDNEDMLTPVDDD